MHAKCTTFYVIYFQFNVRFVNSDVLEIRIPEFMIW